MKKNNLKQRVTTRVVTNYIPTDDAVTDIIISGNVIEMRVLENYLSHISRYKRISKNEYIDTQTKEVQSYQHKYCPKKARNLNRSFEKLRALINTNFSADINELHVVLTYAEKMEDFDKASKDFKCFWEKLHYLKPDLAYIRVIEPQQTGTWHIHVLVKSIQHCYLFLQKDEIEKMWGHGHVWISKIKENDNIGAYFTAFHKELDLFEQASSEPNERKCIIKGARLHFYPPNKRFYSYSKGIDLPIKLRTSFVEALQLIDVNDLVYCSATEIVIVDDETKKEFTVNQIGRFQFNSKRNRKDEVK